jgi:hypothetical protein
MCSDAPTIGGGGTVQVVEGQEAIIECAATGDPPPKIAWERNSRRMSTRQRFVVIDNVRRHIFLPTTLAVYF